MHKLKIKPLSINDAWQGRKFKSDAYEKYISDCLEILPDGIEIPDGKITLHLAVGFSNSLSDVDNVQKPFIDILQKKYKFNDRNIFFLTIHKEIVDHGDDYISFNFQPYVEQVLEVLSTHENLHARPSNPRRQRGKRVYRPLRPRRSRRNNIFSNPKKSRRNNRILARARQKEKVKRH